MDYIILGSCLIALSSCIGALSVLVYKLIGKLIEVTTRNLMIQASSSRNPELSGKLAGLAATAKQMKKPAHPKAEPKEEPKPQSGLRIKQSL